MTEQSDDYAGERLAERFASQLEDRWRRGEEANLAAVLGDFPQLKQHKSVVLRLARDEYQQRLDRGESLEAEEFCRRFPSLHRSLLQLIRVDALMGPSSAVDPEQASVAWPAPGSEFLGFSLRGELGRGAFGRVFLASEAALGSRLVVVKVAVHGGQEAETLGRLRHPNIMPVYSIQDDPRTGLTAICMPYLGKATLGDVLDCAFCDSRVPTQARVVLETIAARHDGSELAEAAPCERILRKGSYVDGVIHLGVQLADALAYTHARGVCHHDLKPSNVLLAIDGRPLLLDFNLSFDERTYTRRFGGTLPYMAPEQLQLMAARPPAGPAAETSEVSKTSEGAGFPRPDPRSDLFSLGVILYEILSGELPFGPMPRVRSLEDTARRLFGQQTNGPQPLRAKNPRVGRRLAQIIDQCLAFEPDRRPQTAAVLAATLRRELAPVCRARRWVADHRKAVSATVGALLAVALCWGAFLALRPSYEVRQLRRGLEHYDQGRYELAVECFDSAIRAAPDDSAAALLARGKAYLKLKDPRAAYEDFRTAFDQRPSAPAAAGMGFSLSLLRHYNEAVGLYHMAMSMGNPSAALLNNIGYCCRKLILLEEAEASLKQATEIDGELQAPHYNLAVLYMQRALAGKPLPAAACVHISKAIDIGPPCADLYRVAADLCMLTAKHDPDAVQRALGYLEKAHSLGLDAAAMKSNPLLRPLHGLEPFQRLLAAPPKGEPVQPDLLIDPLRGSESP